MIFSNRRRGSYIGSDIIGSGIYTGISCDYSLYSNGIITIKIPFVESPQDSLQILSLNAIDIGLGQVPKFNTLDPIDVIWVDSSGVIQTDTEAVIAHTNATNVVITRETTATATYSHKTGLPIPNLLGYYDDSSNLVLFGGVYEIPDTVTSPVTFEWEVTNGNVSGAVTQTPFSQVLTINSLNDVVMPSFTDDWGNSATLLSRTVSVSYGQTVYPATILDDAIALWAFGAPITTEPSVIDTRIDNGTFVTSVSDTKGGLALVQATNANQPIPKTSAIGGEGIGRNLTTASYLRNTFDAINPIYGDQMTFVFEFTPELIQSGTETFQYIIGQFENICTLDIFESSNGSQNYRMRLSFPGGSSILFPAFGNINNVAMTVIVTLNRQTGQIVIYREINTSLSSLSFSTATKGGLITALYTNYSQTLRGTLHRMYVLPYIATLAQRTEIFALTQTDYKI